MVPQRKLMKMKYLLLILFTGFISASQAQAIRKVKMDEVAKMIDTAKGPLIINFFATWCSPCVHELPYFEKQATEKNIQLVLVSLDFPETFPNGIRSFMTKSKYKSKVLWLADTNADEYCPKIDKTWSGAIPVTIMVNNAKKYRRFYDSQLTEQRLAMELKNLLD
ncbi:MAG: hypothetical protein JWN76_3405 [Chitinophagaceae bacterium]|nr:hypothetical protein [Chitinophagaceae bacterium]